MDNRNTSFISTSAIKVHPRNTEFFDDISGEDYENFKNSIREDGILVDIIVAPDMTVLSGHQRLKAALELGIEKVPVQIKDVKDENDKLRILLAANFGRNKNDEAKQRKIIAEYVSLCGYKNGEMGNGRKKECQVGTPTPKLTLEEIAAELKIPKRSLQRVLKIERDLSEPMKKLLDDGVISKVVAADIIAALSPKEQNELLISLDATQRYTQKEVQEYINEIKKLKENPPLPSDYDFVKERNRILSLQNERLEGQIASMQLEEAESDSEGLKQTIRDLHSEINNLKDTLAEKDRNLQNLETQLNSVPQIDGNYEPANLFDSYNLIKKLSDYFRIGATQVTALINNPLVMRTLEDETIVKCLIETENYIQDSTRALTAIINSNQKIINVI